MIMMRIFLFKVSIGNTAVAITEHPDAKAYYNRPDLVEAALRGNDFVNYRDEL